MFDGSLATLDDVIDHYQSGGSLSFPNKAAEIGPLSLTETQKENLKDFLNSLTDDSFLRWAESITFE